MLKCNLKGKSCWKLAIGLNINDSENIWTCSHPDQQALICLSQIFKINVFFFFFFFFVFFFCFFFFFFGVFVFFLFFSKLMFVYILLHVHELSFCKVAANQSSTFRESNLDCFIRRAATRENRSSGFPTRSDTNRALQSQKQARSLKFRI